MRGNYRNASFSTIGNKQEYLTIESRIIAEQQEFLKNVHRAQNLIRPTPQDKKLALAQLMSKTQDPVQTRKNSASLELRDSGTSSPNARLKINQIGST